MHRKIESETLALLSKCATSNSTMSYSVKYGRGQTDAAPRAVSARGHPVAGAPELGEQLRAALLLQLAGRLDPPYLRARGAR
eukprot:5442028-Pleurochrysis_carterae.AAC.4